MEEVIYALASPPPPAPLVLLRLDGDGAAGHIEALLASKALSGPPRTPRTVDLIWQLDAPPAPVVVIKWKRGASWTGNEGVELLLPGSTPIVDGIFGRLEQAGARLAQPGEFTRRAFINGRIDLSRAESVAALIKAEDRASLAAARRVMEGELAQGIGSAADSLLDVIAIIEAGLDFSEQEVESPGTEGARKLLQPILIDLDNLLSRRQWTADSDGIPRVLLWGRANAGKSSLFNALLGKDRAIASAVAGTTTDAVGGTLHEGERQIELLDLPGQRSTHEELGTLALERAAQLLEGDDPVLWVIDATCDPAEIEQEKHQISVQFGSRVQPVLTQIDLISPGEPNIFPEAPRVSSMTGEGIDALRGKLFRWTSITPGRERSDAIRFTRRQWQLVNDCRDRLGRAIEEAEGGPELLVADLREALTRLEEVTGKSTPEDVLDRIFSRFCLGK
ncbi:MAG TPA: GTP-binding protein [Planctomycetes bacterium]|nr:GTP-binding protein [Planctomycetota bacterium]